MGEEFGPQCAPTAPKPRQLLALLALNANKTVSMSMCVDELWDTKPPATAVSTVQTYVLQIRRALRRLPGTDERLHTRPRGYELTLDHDELDLTGFTDRVARARRAFALDDYESGALLLREALGEWTGEALADVDAGPLISAHLTTLRELRFSCLEERIEAELRLGLHHELISELLGLVQEYPVHENLHAQLLVALHRAGRRAQAVEQYTRLRRSLHKDLGIAPSPRIEHLYRAVVSADPALDPPRAGASAIARSLDLVEQVS
ncbi:AfsR/SARP family transcriptional regulator [Lentzea cavernae]|uniref:AfsR/SARP family transcriptional regulator n=1 Tax=Lentzea cavernae TaxID=2020703 RepID=UPI00227D7EBB|nr:AfsR/SARP family transcriptional regulator [Lentzea cavernae]